MYQQTEHVIIRLSDGAFIPKVPGNRDYEQYLQWLALGNSPEPIPEPTLDELKVQKVKEINAACDLTLNVILDTYPEGEVETWFLQAEEAKAYLADNTASTPFIDQLVAERGTDKATLVNKIILKSQAFTHFSGAVNWSPTGTGRSS